jgi:hypothetical protein
VSLFLAIHVEGHRREDGVQGQVHPSEEDVHVLVLDPHVRAPEREPAEAARGDPNLLQDLRLGLEPQMVSLVWRAQTHANELPTELSRGLRLYLVAWL